MTIALYCRVSTEEQAQHGFSLEAQKDRLIAYCQSQGWRDYEVYMDDGYTGTSLERPALKRLIRHIERGNIESVIVYRLDRLSRRQRHCLHLLEEVFDKHNVSFRSATEPFDTSTPLGKAMLGILAVFAQLERETIIERTKEGHYKRARQGLWGGGPVPFGYTWNKEQGVLEVVPEEAHIVRGVFRRYLDGHVLGTIADWVKQRTKDDRWWDHTVIKFMLQRDIYAGYVKYGTERAKGNHEPIVDEETFERAQREVKQRNNGKRAIGKYLLTGLLRCGQCGEPMLHAGVKRPNGKYHQYYVCGRRQKGRHYYKGGSCDGKHYHMEIINNEVVAKVNAIATDPSMLFAQDDNAETIKAQSAIESLESQLATIERKLRRWYDAYEDEELDTKEVSRRVRELEQDKAKVQLLMDEAKDALEKPDPKPMLDALNAVRDAWEKMTFDEQQSVLRMLLRHITIYKDGSQEIEWNL